MMNQIHNEIFNPMSLLSLFYQQCENTPDAIAFIEADRRVSYQQVQALISQISTQLMSENNPCQRIIIYLERGIDAAIALLATLHSGACYIPLDLKNPSTRLNFIIDDVDSQCIIGRGSCPEWLSSSHLWLDIDSCPLATTPYIPKEINPESLAAILYTSGSTGQPKGVALSHRAIKNFSDWAAATFKINQSDQVASLAPFYFDLSTFDLFTSLSCGASIHFVPAQLTFSPSRLTRWLSEHKISVWYTVPSILSFIALKGSLDTTPLPSLKKILFAGEVFLPQPLINLCNQLPDVEFYNLYGPTETNVCCYWKVDRNRLHHQQSIPIGHSACDATLSIDPNNNELHVSSDNNLSGYWQKGQLNPALPENGFYKTGDRATLNEYGEYCYHGRLDRMLKCSGYRVEPAEIETIILQCDKVEQCVVLGIKDSTSGQRPVAMIVLKDHASLTTIASEVRQKLPSYMHPCRYITLKSLPYLLNGKIDYLSLQQQIEK
jgi:amino acid adenylation domain-containing protein